MKINTWYLHFIIKHQKRKVTCDLSIIREKIIFFHQFLSMFENNFKHSFWIVKHMHLYLSIFS